MKKNYSNCFAKKIALALMVICHFFVPRYSTAQCNLGAQTASPAATGCSLGAGIAVGSGGYYDFTTVAGTYYDFTYTNGSSCANMSGMCITAQNGSGATANQSNVASYTGWYTGTTTLTRLSIYRSSSTWVVCSGTLKYKYSTPTNPTFSVAPTSVCTGTGITYSINASSYATSYVWSVTGGGGSITAGQGTASATITFSTAGTATVSVYATNNSLCNSGTITTSTITVAAPPTITTQPTSPATVCTGGTGAMSIAATGATSYQWQYNNGGTWVNAVNGTPAGSTYSGVTGTSFSVAGISAAGSYQYRCMVSGAGTGCSVISSIATVTIAAQPTISTQPVSPTGICVGGATSNITIAATGGTPSLTYQWQYNNGGTWDNVTNGTPAGSTYSGGTSTSFSVAGISTAGSYQYRCLVNASGGSCAQAVSNTINVVVADQPSISTQPTSPAAICTGGTTANMVIAATGGAPSLAYQWQYNNGGTWGNVANSTPAGAVYSGNTGTSFSVAGVSVAGSFDYRCVVTAAGNNCTSPLISNTVTVTVSAQSTISTQPASPAAVCIGGTTNPITIAATGGIAPLSYQWQYLNGATWGNVVNTTPAGSTYTGNTTTSFTVAGITTAGSYSYRCIVTGSGSGCSVVSSTAVVSVIAQPAISTQPTSPAAICMGGTTANMTIAATGGTPSLSYQWQYNDGGTWEDATNASPAGASYTGATATTFSVAGINTAGSYQYRCLVNAGGSNCAQATSNTVTVTVTAQPSITTQPSSPTAICSGGTTSAITIAATGGTPSLTYQWQYLNGATWGNVVNATPAGSTYTGGTSTSFTVAGITAAGTYQYRCMVNASGSACASDISNTISVVVAADPTITTQPTSPASVCTGGTATAMTIAATGGSPSLTYQWQYLNGATWGNVVNATPAGSTYSGNTTTSFTVAGITTAGTYSYRCLVNAAGNGCTQAVSNTVTVTFVAQPAISTQPTSPAAICTGGTTANMTIAATGGTPSLSYQWQYNDGGTWEDATNASPAGASYTGATATTFSVAGINTAGSYQYRCLVNAGGSNCAQATSNTITVTVTAQPSITTQPSSPTAICVGGTTSTITIAATGGTPSLTYQWQYLNGATWGNVVNATPAGSTYTGGTSTSFTVAGITAAGTYQYRCMVNASGSACASDISNTISVVVAADPTITTQPTSPASVCTGGAPAAMNIAATGGSPSLTYQWQYLNGATWGNVVNATPAGSTYSGNTSTSFTVAGITTAGTYSYRCLVNAAGNGCTQAVSNTVTVTFVAQPAISTQPTSPAAICTGGTTANMTIAATGGTPSLSYQWQYNDGGTWEDATNASPAGASYTGATATTFSVAGINTAGSYQYRCLVNAGGSNCAQATSNTITVTVTGQPAVTTEPVDPSPICTGGTTSAITIAATGGTPSLTYQWQYLNGATWGNVANATPAGSTYTGGTAASFSVAGITTAGTYQYRCRISASGSACASTLSATVNVVVSAQSTISTQPASPAAVCIGGTTNPITIAATGGIAPLSYQWQYLNGATWGNVTNATPAGSTYTGNTTTSFTVAGITTAGSYSYRCIVTGSGSGCSVVSSTAVVSVIAQPAISTQPTSPAAICTGGTTANMTIAATGGTPSLSYQWQYSDGGTWEDATNASPAGASYTGATATTFSVAGINTAGSYQYRCLVNAGGSNCAQATSNTVTVTVTAQPSITTEPVSPSAICSGGTTSAITIAATGGTPSLTYQWQYLNGATWGNVVNATPAGSTYTGGTSTSFTVAGITAAGTYQYRCMVNASGSACASDISNTISVVVAADPTITTQPTSPASVCTGGTATAMTIAATGGSPSLTYQWQYLNGATWGNVVNATPAGSTYSGNTTTSFTVAGITTAGTYSYRCLVNAAGNGCTQAVSNTVTVTFVAQPAISTQPTSPAAICTGGTTANMTIAATGGTPSLSYQWQYNDGGTWEDATNASPAGASYTGATATTFSVAGINTAGSYQYRCLVNAGGSNCAQATSSTVTVTVTAQPSITTQPSSPTAICVGGTTSTITIAATGGTPSLTYQWQYLNGATWGNVVNATPAGSTYTGGTAASFSVAGITTVGNYSYRCIVAASGSACASQVSNTVTVQVKAQASISSQPVSPASVCTGGSVTLNITAINGGPTLAYQWQYLNGATWGNVVNATPAGSTYSGNTTTSFSVAGITTAGTYSYRCLVISTGSNCTTPVVSSTAVVTVVAQSTITTQPASPAAICTGGTTAGITIAATGGIAPLAYQWQYNDGGTWDNVANSTPAGATYTGATATTFSAAGINTAGAYQYRCIVSGNGNNCSVVSNTVTVTVANQPDITTQPASPASICTGGTTSAITIAATGGAPSLTYQWQYLNGATWGNVVNASPAGAAYTGGTSTSFSVAGITAPGSYSYRCLVAAAGNACATDVSNTITVTVSAQIGITTQPASPAAICTGGTTAAITLATSGGTPAPVYQWQYLNGATWGNVTAGTPAGATYSGETTTSFTVADIITAGSYNYRCIITATGGSCSSATSNTVTVTVAAQPVINTQPISPAAICEGGTTSSITIAATGGAPALTYQWQYNNGGIWGNVSNSTPAGATYTGPTGITFSVGGISAYGAYQYRCLVNATGDNCAQAISNTITVNVHQQVTSLAAAFGAGENPICEGNTLHLAATNATGTNVTYNWNGPGSYSATNNQTPTRTSILESNGEGTYTVSAVNACGTVTATTPALNVHRNILGLSADVLPNPICEGSDLDLTATYSGAPLPATDVTWTWDGSNSTYNATGQNVTRTNIQTTDDGIYYVHGTNACGTVSAGSAYITVDALITANADYTALSIADPTPLSGGGPIRPICGGSHSFTLFGNNPAPGSGLWTQLSGSNTTLGSAGSATTTANYTGSNNTETYEYTITNGACVSSSDVRVYFDPAIVVTTTLAGCTFVSPDKDVVEVTATGGTVFSPNVLAVTPSSGNVPIATPTAALKVYAENADGANYTYTVADDFTCTASNGITTNSTHPLDIPHPSSTSGTQVVGVTCYDKAYDKWLTFRDANNDALVAIQDNEVDLGQVQVTMYKDGLVPQILQSVTANNCQGVYSTAMQRHFVVTSPAAQPFNNVHGDPALVTMRLYFSQSELDSLIAASVNNDEPSTNNAQYACSHNDNIYNISQLYVTKYSGSLEDGDYSNNDIGGIYKVYGAPTVLPTQPDGPLSVVANGFSSLYSGATAHHYVELNVDRFSEIWLHGSQNGTPLPVEMLYIEAHAVDNSYIMVKWATVLEINNDGFIVERSTDGQNWSAIGWVEGHDNTTTQQNYSYNDYNVTAGVRYYYRLKQVDNDGQYEYTGVVSAIISGQVTFNVKDFIPNPASGTTQLIITATNEQEIEVNIYNVIGEKVLNGTYHLTKGSNQITFNVGALAAGTYTASVSAANEVYTKKLVVTR